MNKRVKLFVPVVLFLVMAGLLWFGLGRDPNQVPSAMIDRQLPEFSLPSLLDPTQMYTQEDLLGNGVTIMNFWATWCPPCHVEHPYLVEISEREEDLHFVGVNYKNQNPGENPRQYLEERGNPFDKVIVDASGGLGIDLGVTGAPETFIVDSSGTIRYRHVGIINHQVWEETFEPIIAQIQQ